MTIKEGYDGKKTEIKIYARTDCKTRKAELWLEQEGVKTYFTSRATKNIEESESHSETLHYITLEELLALRDECNAVIQELVA